MLLLDGHPWKEKDARDSKKDKQCVGAVKKLKGGSMTTNDYIEIVIKIMGDY